MSQVDAQALISTIEQTRDRGLIRAAQWLLDLSNDLSAVAVVDLETSDRAWKQTFDVQYALAKSFFDCGEYARCAHRLKSSGAKDAKSHFLRLYSLYLMGEKARDEDGETVLGPLDGKHTNTNLVLVLSELEDLKQNENTDSYLLYLLGVIYRQLGQVQQATTALIESLRRAEYNRAAWEELSACMSSSATVNKTLSQLPQGMFAEIFHVQALLDLHASGEEVSNSLQILEQIFVNSLCCKSFRALLAYNAQDFETAEVIFDELMELDPYRIDHLDIYSNVLYVLERRSKLGHLSKIVSDIDKFKPETCCVIGNYYSLLGDHEKAVTYFRKALKLNKSYLAAWTLMGHEYMELKNTHAAIESYRRAVDINKMDYRAWYGLGQTYEVLEMHYYALHYFEKAASLKYPPFESDEAVSSQFRPFDTRMWTAMGNCFERLGRFSEAIKAYRRALIDETSLDLMNLMKLGELYERAGDLHAARKHFQAVVNANVDDSALDVTAAVAWLERYDRQ